MQQQDDLAEALERIMSAADPDEQADKEIVRYWNERIGQAAGKDVNFARRLRVAIARRLQDKG